MSPEHCWVRFQNKWTNKKTRTECQTQGFDTFHVTTSGTRICHAFWNNEFVCSFLEPGLAYVVKFGVSWIKPPLYQSVSVPPKHHQNAGRECGSQFCTYLQYDLVVRNVGGIFPKGKGVVIIQRGHSNFKHHFCSHTFLYIQPRNHLRKWEGCHLQAGKRDLPRSC